MGKGAQNVSSDDVAAAPPGKRLMHDLTWAEVKQHDQRGDKWIVIDGEVYDITRWAQKHPGGSRVISHYAGQDASEAFKAFHKEEGSVRKYLKAIHVGSLRASDAKPSEIQADMEQLRKTAHKMGLFTPSMTFYALNILQLVVLEVFAYWVLSTYGSGWVPFLLALAAHGTVQAQSGWLQHDFGHLSVFKSPKWNHFGHQIILNITKGAAAVWWNHLHYQHHAKPNVLDKDPDVRLDALFVVGDTMAKKKAKEKTSMPYNWQQWYFFATLPPLLFPVYFQIIIFYHCITRKCWFDLATILVYYFRFFYVHLSLMDVGSCLLFYFLMRVIESHWFVWVSQSNHIPMEVDEDKARPWLSLQLHATCDIERSAFNDWFTGHLNFQIEHHLFPMMPRHNLYKIAPMVKTLCKKHNIPYVTKTLLGSFRDIVSTLESSGQIWSAYYHAYHLE